MLMSAQEADDIPWNRIWVKWKIKINFRSISDSKKIKWKKWVKSQIRSQSKSRLKRDFKNFHCKRDEIKVPSDTMGNYCSSSQKDKDNVSEKSEEWVRFFDFRRKHLNEKITFIKVIYLFLIHFHITNIFHALEFRIYFNQRDTQEYKNVAGRRF